MDTIHNNQLITTLVTRMVLQIAPREMQLFQCQKEEYLRDPQQIINNRGFTTKSNSHEKILFLAPIIRAILCDVLSLLEKESSDEPPHSQTASNRAQTIYNFAYEKAIHFQLSPLKAQVVANAVLDNLSFSSSIT
jgi:hypothetical protein